MSLKAKIEAVIYAAEEPVTLVQLATLFREEALEARLAREAAQLAAPVDPIAAVPDLPSPVEEELQTGEQEAQPEPAVADETPEATFEAAPEAALESVPESIPDSTVPEAVDEVLPEAVPELPAEPSADDERRRERQRDREAREELRRILDELIVEYATSGRGMEIREIAGGYRVGTKPEYHDAVRSFVKSLKPPMKLSLQALETLAVVAYKQPITAPEVSEIRGVDSAGVLGSLMSRKLIATAGRKQVIGRPILYKTTKEFLLRFGLKDINELPSVEEFEKMAGELSEQPGDLPFTLEAAAPESVPHPISVSLEPSDEETADLPGVNTQPDENTEVIHEG
ncbi:SMC-Scp complex subunit ScpB [Acidipila rosea]|uniref:Condensin subunit ScpB n=1 Tax=Acidipila rosea TaxID=768535 RepID=A0A4R1L669_9BACT|nr:SMC-Scp complex subunit ScpB [Acidipila rosea]TCK72550.1 condensin subunit ScpB [Acidipila rosea]